LACWVPRLKTLQLQRGVRTLSRLSRFSNPTNDATTEWLRLTWAKDGKARELVTTPGHHSLDRFGRSPTIGSIVRDSRATVVLASRELAEVTAERIVYSAETAHLFERAMPRAHTGDGATNETSLTQYKQRARTSPTQQIRWKSYFRSHPVVPEMRKSRRLLC
jgi:hypothetical protein